jgi:hypothetical protein
MRAKKIDFGLRVGSLSSPWRKAHSRAKAKRSLIRFKEKGGKEKELPVHHKLEEILDQYLKATGLEKEPESPLFPAVAPYLGLIGGVSDTDWAAQWDSVGVVEFAQQGPLLHTLADRIHLREALLHSPGA